MAKKAKNETSKQFSVQFPIQILEEIDTICALNYISRSSWLIKAARELLEKERKIGSEELLKKLSMEEKNIIL